MLLRQGTRRLSSRPLNIRRVHYASKPLLEDLSERGFIQDATRLVAILFLNIQALSTNILIRRDALERAVESNKQTVYAGVDPTASALHIGHLVPLMCLLHFKIRGHNIIPLVRNQ